MKERIKLIAAAEKVIIAIFKIALNFRESKKIIIPRLKAISIKARFLVKKIKGRAIKKAKEFRNCLSIKKRLTPIIIPINKAVGVLKIK